MAESLRREILHQFKKLHRTRLNTFKGDEHALKVVRDKINGEYRKYGNVTNEAAILELNKFAQEVEHELRTNIIQAVKKKPGVFALRITPDVLLDNATCDNSSTQCNNQDNSVNQTLMCGKNTKK
ncbi:hypothetical protein KPH14_010578 [Odynerus spinipes]|uniref:Complex III assembly factor LYRM7 n=1 Tax=Odynerus spinipes TaxID=1348599 RepID=A0AAD9VU09_9HYME|nr:hypothetical protein KPH14_010578 [Odynerus spinipes]